MKTSLNCNTKLQQQSIWLLGGAVYIRSSYNFTKTSSPSTVHLNILSLAMAFAFNGVFKIHIVITKHMYIDCMNLFPNQNAFLLSIYYVHTKTWIYFILQFKKQQ